GCEAAFHDEKQQTTDPKKSFRSASMVAADKLYGEMRAMGNGEDANDLRPCAYCGQPGTAADPLQHGCWRPRKPEGDWVHAGCRSAWQAGGWRRRVDLKCPPISRLHGSPHDARSLHISSDQGGQSRGGCWAPRGRCEGQCTRGY